MTSYYYPNYFSLAKNNYYIYTPLPGGGPRRKGSVAAYATLHILRSTLFTTILLMQLMEPLRGGQPCLESVTGMLARWFGVLCSTLQLNYQRTHAKEDEERQSNM